MRAATLLLTGYCLVEAIAFAVSEAAGGIVMLIHPAVFAIVSYLAVTHLNLHVVWAGVVGFLIAAVASIANFYYLGDVVGRLFQSLDYEALQDLGPFYSLLVMTAAAMGCLAGIVASARRKNSNVI